MPNVKELMSNYQFINDWINDGTIVSAFALKTGGIAEGLAKMAFGNKIGVDIQNEIDSLFDLNYGSILVESTKELVNENAVLIGRTIKDKIIYRQETISIDEAIHAWSGRYESIYPITLNQEKLVLETMTYSQPLTSTGKNKTPHVSIPVFPGTNCEYDSERAFSKAGARTSMCIFRNQSKEEIKDSIKRLTKQIDESEILMLSGGFSSGDEPDGSGKFITAVLMNEQVRMSIEKLLERDGLILGICNGFQALIKSGLLPYGKIGLVNEQSPTLVRNEINHHKSQFVSTKIISNKSPWFSGMKVGDIYKVPISHGEGKFIAPMDVVKQLFKQGQVTTQYVDLEGLPTMDGIYNPNGSMMAIEGITSIDGKILGKMAHSERFGHQLYKNIDGVTYQDLFSNGVKYFKD